MATHIKVLGILHIALAALGVIAALTVMLVFGGIAGVLGIAGSEGDLPAHVAIPLVGAIGGVIAIFLLLISIPGFVAGIGLLQYREWARILTIVLSAVELLNVPFGTALGIYGLWVLLQNETIRLFHSPPARQAPAYR